MRHKKEPPYHLLKAEQVLLDHAMFKYNGEVTGRVEFDSSLNIIADILFHPQKKRYVGDVSYVISTLQEATSTSAAESNFGITSSFSPQPFRDNRPRQ